MTGRRPVRRQQRRLGLLATTTIACLLAAACGARLDPQLRQSAADAVLGVGTTHTAAAAPGQGPAQTVTRSGAQPSGTAGTTGGTAGTAGTEGTQAKSGSTRHVTGQQQPGTSGNDCPTSGSDVGLTSKTIDLGTMADLSGPVPGLFVGAQQGVEAFANYVNSTGGICGHQVHFDVADGGTNCQQTQNDAASLIAKDFALLGSFTLYDGCTVSVLKQHPTVPDLHVGLDPAVYPLPNHLDIAAGTRGALTGGFAYYARKYPTRVKRAGTIYENIPSAAAEQQNFTHAAESTGWRFVASISEAPTTGDFQSDFQKLCGQQHIQLFFTETETAQNAATMISDENKVAACKGLINVIPIAYDQAFVKYCQQLGCGANANTVTGWNAYPLFFNPDEAARIPELKLFQTWFARTNPGKPASLYALYAWAYGRMLQQAFEHAGSTANRRTVLAALQHLHGFTANHMMPPADPSTKDSGTHCYILWQLTNSSFSRIDSPRTGYRCDGTFLSYQ